MLCLVRLKFIRIWHYVVVFGFGAGLMERRRLTLGSHRTMMRWMLLTRLASSKFIYLYYCETVVLSLVDSVLLWDIIHHHLFSTIHSCCSLMLNSISLFFAFSTILLTRYKLLKCKHTKAIFSSLFVTTCLFGFFIIHRLIWMEKTEKRQKTEVSYPNRQNLTLIIYTLVSCSHYGSLSTLNPLLCFTKNPPQG